MKISENTIKEIHLSYANHLYDLYQAQPSTPDEFFRFSFVTEMIREHTLFVDGDVLWTNLPHYNMEFCDYDSNEHKDYEKNVATPIRNIYAQLSALNLERSLNIPRVLMKVRNYFIAQKFSECIQWIEKLGAYPNVSERIVESLEENYFT